MTKQLGAVHGCNANSVASDAKLCGTLAFPSGSRVHGELSFHLQQRHGLTWEVELSKSSHRFVWRHETQSLVKLLGVKRARLVYGQQADIQGHFIRNRTHNPTLDEIIIRSYFGATAITALHGQKIVILALLASVSGGKKLQNLFKTSCFGS